MYRPALVAFGLKSYEWTSGRKTKTVEPKLRLYVKLWGIATDPSAPLRLPRSIGRAASPTQGSDTNRRSRPIPRVVWPS